MMSPLFKAIQKFCTKNHLFTNLKLLIYGRVQFHHVTFEQYSTYNLHKLRCTLLLNKCMFEGSFHRSRRKFCRPLTTGKQKNYIISLEPTLHDYQQHRFQIFKKVGVHTMTYFLKLSGFKQTLAILLSFCCWTFLKSSNFQS